MSEVVFVGTSDAFGAGGRRQAAIVARFAGGTVLLDCGGTTLTGLVELSIPREEIDAVLLSHFHADHFGGIPQLLLAAEYEDRRRRPLCIAGPRGVEARVRQLCHALGHPLEPRDLGYPLEFLELPKDHETELGPVRVRAFETRHQPDACPHGVVLQSGRERVVYSGDTGWFDALPRHAEGAQLFICECTQLSPGYAYHLSHEELVEHAKEFDCGRIVLTHLGAETSRRRGKLAFDTADDGLVLRI